jgi:hypothetical protein
MNNTPMYISTMIIYTLDEYGNRKYDYQEMAEHFAFQLWLLDRDNDIDINVNTSGYFDDLENDDSEDANKD